MERFVTACGGTPEEFAHVLKISCETIKANDSSRTVLIGGLAIDHREEGPWRRTQDMSWD